MKRLLAKSILLAGGMTASSQLLALGLGELNLDSALNQPLQAEIQMIDSADLTSAEIKPRLASEDDFARAGVERYQFLRQMKFSVNGDRIIITTRDPINEPFLNFLVELNWPAGRVLREYTVLLDPPVFQEETIRPLVAVPAASVTSTATVASGSVSTSQAQRPESKNTWGQPAQPGTYKVQPNDTLWQIALETRPNSSITPQQMMIALQDVNPDAFINGNINRLKTHTVLDIPDESIIRTVAQREAVTEVNRQNRELKASVAQIDATGRAATTGSARGNNGGGEVRLISSNDAGKAGAATGAVSGGAGVKAAALENDLAIALENLDKSRRENQELVDRLSSLEEQLAKMERLIALQNDQLANIQLNASESNAKAAVESKTPVVAEKPVEPAVAPAVENKPAVETAEIAAPEKPAVVAGETVQQEPSSEEATADVAQTGTSTDYNYAEGQTAAPAVAEVAEDADAKAAALREKLAAERRKAMEAAAADANKSPVDGIVSTVMSLPIELLLAFVGGILVLIYGVIRVLRGRKENEEDVTEDSNLADDGLDNFDAAAMPMFDEKESSDLPAFESNDDTVVGGDFSGGNLGNGELASDGLDDFELHQDDLGEMPVTDDMDDLDLGGFDDADGEQYETVGQTEDAISESDIYIAYGKFDQATELLNKAILAEPERVDLRLKLLEVLVSLDDAERFSAVESGLIAIGDVDANDRARDLRSQLSSPLEPTMGAAALSLDDEIPSLDESADSEFEGGMDFGEALDFGDDVTPEDDGIGASLEELPDIELGETADFNAEKEGVDMSLEEDALELDDDLLDFQLDDADDELTAESVADTEDGDDLDSLDEVAPLEFAVDDVPVANADESPEFDVEFATEETESADNDELNDLVDLDDALTLDDSVELTELDVTDADSADEDLPADLDLAGDIDEDLLSVSLDDESEVVSEADDTIESLDLTVEDEAVLEAPESSEDLEFDLELDAGEVAGGLDALDADLDELDVPEFAVSDDSDSLDTEESVAVEVEETPATEAEAEAEAESDDAVDELSADALALAEGDLDPSDDSDLIGGIDLDELAAADDEFDFLSGTDECATKLDLARAYIDMEDFDGAKELLSEVVSEGSDQQKQDAKDLLGNLA